MSSSHQHCCWYIILFSGSPLMRYPYSKRRPFMVGRAPFVLLVVLCGWMMPKGAAAFFPILPARPRIARKRSIRKIPQYNNNAIPLSAPAPSRLSLSPSGIDEWPVAAQAGIFTATYLGLAGGTWLGSNLLDALSRDVVGLERWRLAVIDTTLPLLLGAFYTTAGVAHFASAEAFQQLYPPPGTWGFWYLPGSAAFHVAWTGGVEVLGGVGLLFGGVQSLWNGDAEEEDDNLLPKLVLPLSALSLFLLTIVVTPANIYMFTHGATMGDSNMPPLDGSFHAIRFGVQVVLLSLLWTLAKDSFFYAWGDELD